MEQNKVLNQVILACSNHLVNSPGRPSRGVLGKLYAYEAAVKKMNEYEEEMARRRVALQEAERELMDEALALLTV